MKKKYLAFLLCTVMTVSSILPVYGSENATTGANLPSSSFVSEADSTAAENTAADSTAADSTAADSTATDGTAADSTTADSTAADSTQTDSTGADSTSAAAENTADAALLSSASLSDGSVYVIRNFASSKYVLDVAAGSVGNSANVQLYTYNASNAQKWCLKANNDGTYTFINQKSGKVLNVSGGSSADKANVDQYTPTGAASQSWNVISNTDGSVTLKNAASGKVLDICAGKLANKTNIWQYRSNGSAAQKFTLEKISSVDQTADDIVIRPSCAPGKVLDVKGASLEKGANIQIYRRNHTDAQSFAIKAAGNGYYSIFSTNSGLALDVKSSGRAEGTNVWQYRVNGTAAQDWRIVINDDLTVSIFSALKSDMALTVAGNGSENGTNVQINTYTGAAGQKFTISNNVLNDLEGTYVIRSAVNTDRVLDILAASTAAEANVQSYDNNWTQAQQFKIKNINGDVYAVYNAKSNLVLEAASEEAANGVNVRQNTYTGAESQKWKIVENADGSFTFRSMLDTDYVLDIAAGSTSYGANVQIYKSNGTAAQKWYLTSQRITSCILSDASTIKVSGTGNIPESDDGLVYLLAVPPTSSSIADAAVVGKAGSGSSFTLTAALNEGKANSRLQDRFYTAIYKNDNYHFTSNGMYITNPEACADSRTERITVANKKGLATSSWNYIDQAIDLGVSHVAENFIITQFLYSNLNYAYNYNGKTYYFNSFALNTFVNHVKKLNAAGVEVTGVIYLDASVSGDYTKYITPNARASAASSGATLVGINAQEAGPRATLEALFSCLAEVFSKSDCQIGNWVIGNEIDDPVHWNYCGNNLSISQYTTLYADVYRMVYTAMRSKWSNVRVCTSLDNVWNTTVRGSRYYTSRGILTNLNKILNGEGGISWNLAYHPYCAPVLDCRFWNRVSSVTDSWDSQIITMLNIGQLTSYVKSLGSNHHIVLSESGFCWKTNGVNYLNEQAAAIMYGYYLAEQDDGIDNFIVHQYRDNASEEAGGFYLGIYGHPSEKAFKYMDDADQWKTYESMYVGYINKAKSFADLIPGFNAQSFVH